MHRVFAAIGAFSVRFRWLVVAGWVAAAVLASYFFPSLASVTKANNTDFLPASTPSMQAAQLASPFQGANLTPVSVIVTRNTGQLTRSDAAAIGKLRTVLRRVSGVSAVHDLGTSPDGEADQLLVLANLPKGAEGPAKTLVAKLRAGISAEHLPGDLQAHLAGPVAVQVDSQAASGGTGGSVQRLSVLFILVLLFLIFRSLLAPLVTLAPAFLVVELAGPLIGELTKAGLQVSTLSQLMLIVLILGAGTDYGLFLVFRVREERRRGRDSRAAIVEALARVGESITFSAGTVIAALLSLLLATFGIYSSLGVPLAIGVALMLLAGLSLLPALLAIFGNAVFWPARTRSGQATSGWWGRIAGRVVSRPVITLGVGLALFGALAVASTGYQASGFGSALTPPPGSDSAAGTAALDAHFPKAQANPTNVILRFAQPVWSDPAVLAKTEAALRSSPLFTQVNGPLSPNGATLRVSQLVALHRLLGNPRSLPPLPPAGSPVPVLAWRVYHAESQYISPDGRTLQYDAALAAGAPSTTAAMNAVPAIRSGVASIARSVGARRWGVAGQAPAIYDVSHVSNADLLHVIPVAILVIAVLLALVMRSLVAPAYLIASVALSYLAALGLAVLIFDKIGGGSGLTFILPFLMFLFLLALGEDYNILVMSRIREEARSLPLRQAVSRALGVTGTTVTSAGLVLAGTFAVFAIAGGQGSGGSQIRDVGTGLALGVLMDTFLVRTLLVPSTAVLLGRWNWWPSRLDQGGAAPVAAELATPPAELATPPAELATPRAEAATRPGRDV